MVNDSDLIHTEPFECVHPLTAASVCVSRGAQPAAGSLLWFPCPGMCEDLAGRDPRHLLNIRGNNSWADLKHGHPLHLAVSLRITPAASHSRWQVPVHRPAESGACRRAEHPRFLNNPAESLSPPPSSFCLSHRLSPTVHENEVGGTEWFHCDNIPPCLISHNVSACCWNKSWLRGGCLSEALLWCSSVKDWKRRRSAIKSRFCCRKISKTCFFWLQ